MAKKWPKLTKCGFVCYRDIVQEFAVKCYASSCNAVRCIVTYCSGLQIGYCIACTLHCGVHTVLWCLHCIVVCTMHCNVHNPTVHCNLLQWVGMRLGR